MVRGGGDTHTFACFIVVRNIVHPPIYLCARLVDVAMPIHAINITCTLSILIIARTALTIMHYT